MSVVHRLATTLAVVVLSFSMLQPAYAQSITAAGDISSPPGGPRGDRRTASLIRRWNPTAVLALGDTQYEAGELAYFHAPYGPRRHCTAAPRSSPTSGRSWWPATWTSC